MKLWAKLVGLLGLHLDPMLVAVRTVTTPTKPMEVSSALLHNATKKSVKRKPRLVRYDPRYNVVLYISPDTDMDLVIQLVEWSMGIEWEQTLRGIRD